MLWLFPIEDWDELNELDIDEEEIEDEGEELIALVLLLLVLLVTTVWSRPRVEGLWELKKAAELAARNGLALK